MRKWLKDKRKEKGLTMKEIGGKLGISESYYSSIEGGSRKKKLDLDLASGLSAALEMPISDIVSAEKNGE